MFKCRVCSEKDLRIAELKEQITYLKDLSIPKNDPYNPPFIAQEADAVLSGTQEVIEVDPVQKEQFENYLREQQEIIFERERILSGNY